MATVRQLFSGSLMSPVPAFGFGRHFCAGALFARAEAEVAVNALLDRLPRLRLEPGAAPQVVGLAFRSPERLPVRFD